MANDSLRDNNESGNGLSADLVQPVPIRVMLLAQQPLNSEAGDYIALLPGVSDIIGGDEVDVKGIHGTLVDTVHYAALRIHVERATVLHGGVWVIVITGSPSTRTPFEIGDWLASTDEEQQESLLTLAAPSEPSDSFHIESVSVAYRSQWPIDFFDSLFDDMDEEDAVSDDQIESEIDELKGSVDYWQ